MKTARVLFVCMPTNPLAKNPTLIVKRDEKAYYVDEVTSTFHVKKREVLPHFEACIDFVSKLGHYTFTFMD